MALAVMVAACASTAPGTHPPGRDATGYTLDGRFSLRHGERNVSGRISWTHSPGRDRIMISDPFGNGFAELERSADGARLRLADGKVVEDADAAGLLERVTGLPLPVDDIGNWLTGRTVPAASLPSAGIGEVARDALGRTQALSRHGWQVRFDYGEASPEALPARIVASRADDFELRLVVDQWEIDR